MMCLIVLFIFAYCKFVLIGYGVEDDNSISLFSGERRETNTLDRNLNHRDNSRNALNIIIFLIVTITILYADLKFLWRAYI